MVLVQGIKWVILEKRSTATKIESYLFAVRGSPSTKFIFTSCQGQVETDNRVYKPIFYFLCLAS